MAEDLEGIWRLLNLIEDEQDSVVADDKLEGGTQVDDQRLVVGSSSPDVLSIRMQC